VAHDIIKEVTRTIGHRHASFEVSLVVDYSSTNALRTFVNIKEVTYTMSRAMPIFHYSNVNGGKATPKRKIDSTDNLWYSQSRRATWHGS
jgi:hypothetical protein